MTDDENKRQRHLAEIMIAQCDGKTVQFLSPGDPWSEVTIPMTECQLFNRKFRIKPEPREWWMCPRCAQSLDKSCSQRVTDSLLKSHRDGAGVVCESSFIKVREVLND